MIRSLPQFAAPLCTNECEDRTECDERRGSAIRAAPALSRLARRVFPRQAAELEQLAADPVTRTPPVRSTRSTRPGRTRRGRTDVGLGASSKWATSLSTTRIREKEREKIGPNVIVEASNDNARPASYLTSGEAGSYLRYRNASGIRMAV